MGLNLAGGKLGWDTIPQSVLFDILTNDLDAGVECTSNQFAVNARLGGGGDSLKGEEAL